MSTLRLDYVTARAASFAVTRWHYSRTMPRPPMTCVGAWEDGRFIGVILFSRGASPNLGTPYGVSKLEVCELTRVALTRHKSPVTKIVAIAIRLMRKVSPGLRLIVSFADPRHGHHGGIYQAGNWIYAGASPPSPLYLAPDGKLWHSRNVTARGRVRMYNKIQKTWKPSDCKRIIVPGKHRYLMPLEDKLKRELCSRFQGLTRPSRGGSETVDTSGLHPEEGGSTPTPPLQPPDDEA